MNKKLLMVGIVIVLVIGVAFMMTNRGSQKQEAAQETAATEVTQAADPTDYDEVTLRFCMSGSEQGVDYISAKHFADKVAEATGGKVKIELFASNILAGGSQPEAINMLTQGGSFELGLYSAAVLSNIDQQFLVVMLPFIFDNYADVDKALDGAGNDWMTKKMAEYNLVNFGAMHCGIKQWTNNKKEMKQPSDFKHFKMRIPGGEVSKAIWDALGADPVSMSWSEVYTALQQGVIDGHENGYQTLYSNNIYEVQKYITEANYQYDGYWFMANKAAFDKLKPATQELLHKLGNEMVHYGRDYLEKEEGRIKEELIKKGNVITVLTPEQKQAFIDATYPVVEKFHGVYGDEAYKAWGIELKK